MRVLLATERLLLREWSRHDTEHAFTVYGDNVVTDWLVPSMPYVPDHAAMQQVLDTWSEEQAQLAPPQGRWAIVHRALGEIIGGAELRLLPPHEVDLEIAWHLRHESWGHGYATEAMRALMRWAFENNAIELFAVMDPTNERAHATARRLGMEYVGDTTKYYGRHLDVFRIRPGDIPQESG